MSRNRMISAIIILAFALGTSFIKYFYAYVVFDIHEYRAIPVAIRLLMIQGSMLGLGIFMTAMFAHFSVKEFFHLLGLDANATKAFFIVCICTLPMFLGGFFTSAPNAGTGVRSIFGNAIWPGFFEELIYRGMITGLLVRVAGWKLLPAILASALLFGWGHLYQADSTADAVLIFLLTSAGGAGFALFYKYWRWNLWFPIFMHMLMNLSFVIFDMGNTALMNVNGNIFRAIAIILGVIFTVFQYRKDMKAAYAVNEEKITSPAAARSQGS